MPRFLARLTPALLLVVAVASLHARPVGTSFLRGTVAISDGAAVPPGSLLRVDLHDLTMGIPRQATVAKEIFEIEGETPVHFELTYVESVIAPERLYGVAATITNSRGQSLWETRVPIRVLTLGNQKTVQLVLHPSEQRQAPPEPTSFAVECDGLRFEVDLNDTSATVVLPGSKLVLPRTATSSSKRYSDGSTILAISGRAVYLQRPVRAYRDCKMVVDAP